MLTVLLTATEEAGAEAHRELPMAPEWYGITAIAVFAALFAFTWAFRSVASKH